MKKINRVVNVYPDDTTKILRKYRAAFWTKINPGWSDQGFLYLWSINVLIKLYSVLLNQKPFLLKKCLSCMLLVWNCRSF